MRRGKVAPAATIRGGDVIYLDGLERIVERITKARGRKPPGGGENLCFHADSKVVTIHSQAPVRVIRRS